MRSQDTQHQILTATMSFVIPKIDEQWGEIDIELLEIYVHLSLRV
jgi:hypothetical protein